MIIEWDIARFGLELLNFAGVIILAVLSWLQSRSKANKAAIDRVDERLSEYVRRVDRLEERQGAAPDHDDIGAVYKRLDEVNAQLQHLAGVMEGLTRQLSLVNNHLLHGNNA